MDVIPIDESRQLICTTVVVLFKQEKMNKQQLLYELSHDTFATLKPSPLHGIGVFAIRDIPSGTRTIFSKEQGEWITVSRQEVNALPQHAKELVENHCLYDASHYFLPGYGFKMMDLAVYLNHSDNPNLVSINDGEYFESTRDIQSGEELLIDYGTIVEGE